jgi:hypothetical protein
MITIVIEKNFKGIRFRRNKLFFTLETLYIQYMYRILFYVGDAHSDQYKAPEQ